MLKTFFIKLVALIVRFLTLLCALPLTLIYGYAYFGSIRSYDAYFAVPFLVCWFIVVFPFRLFRSLKNLTIYFYLLEFATFGLIISFIVSANLSIFSVTSIITASLLLLSNLYLVLMYLWHRRDPENINPFLGKEDLKFVVPPVILVLLLLGYLFLDFTLTPRGRMWVNPSQPFELPSSSFNMDPKVLNGRYKLEFSMYTNNKSPLLTAKRTISEKDFVEIKENGKSIFKVDIIDSKVNNVSTYDPFSKELQWGKSKETVALRGTDGKDYTHNSEGYGVFARDKNGVFTKISEAESFSESAKYDLIVAYYLRGGEVEILITKPTDFPERPKYTPFFLRKIIAEKLSIVDPNGEVPLTKSINVRY